ncbi:hypothetical protein ACFZA1_31175 [Streptomyces filipinensis]|uniref:hypothetical protein n=1 Tax=Streptomyces filipinensis TaxID=66887 RepID=UPI000D14594B
MGPSASHAVGPIGAARRLARRPDGAGLLPPTTATPLTTWHARRRGGYDPSRTGVSRMRPESEGCRK